MLTPVRAASNASLSSHSQAAAIVASGLSQSIVAPAPVQAVEAADLNSAIAGKLNLLLAAARARMFDALLDAINSASKALPLPRQDGESNLVFASRLADAIQKLPATRINEIETELIKDGHNLPLRLIAEALKNPAGPEAARVIAYIETVRYKDRDFAARAVVRSYRQNDSSPMRPDARPDILLQEESLLPLAKERPSVPQAPLPAAAAKQTEISGRPVPAAIGVAEELAELIDAVSEEAPAAAFEETHARPATGEAAPAERATESEQTAPVMADQIPRDAVRTGTHRETEPAIPKVWTGVLASITEEASDLIVAIIGEEQTAALLEDLAAGPEVIETIIDETVAEDMARDDMPEMAPAAKPERAEALRLSAAADAAQLARPQRDIVAQPQILPASIVEAVQKSGLLKPLDGVAYAPHPYQFAKDGAEQRDGEMYRRDYEGGDPEGEQQAGSGAQHQQDEEAEPRPQGAAPQDLPEIASEEPSGEKVGDPVYALYQRMVGWE